MPDEFRNLRIIHNRLSSQLLFRLLQLRDWNELKLAGQSGIARSVVSAHLSGQRPIRPHHLTAYLRVFDRDQRRALLSTWLRDNLDQELIADLLDGTKTDSMSSLEENQRRMLDWWATSISRDSNLAKTFIHLTTKAGFKFSSLLLLPVRAAAECQNWLLEKASSLWYFVRSFCVRVEHATVALVTLVLALCQRGGVPQQPAEFAEQVGNLTSKTVATSLVTTSFIAPALADATNFHSDLPDTLPTSQPAAPSLQPDIRDSKFKLHSANNRARRSEVRHRVNPALRIERTIDHQWRRLAAARKSMHSAFARLISDARPRQSKQKQRKR